MILLGSNLPHLWRNEEKYFKKNTKLKAEAIVIHFMPNCFGETFFSLPENKELVKLFDRAGQGVRIKNNTKIRVSELMQKLIVAKNSERIVTLLNILQIIAESKDVKPVCSKGLQFSYPTEETDRLNKIYQYILNNFSREIPLSQIAKVAHISPHSFCRYFKSRIKKTFSSFLLEVRVGHACKLLAESHKTIAEVCFESGFNTFSNFNRHFKSITGTTPSAHRKYYQEIKITQAIEDI
jgi:AraC-like DNA-binding protein